MQGKSAIDFILEISNEIQERLDTKYPGEDDYSEAVDTNVISIVVPSDMEINVQTICEEIATDYKLTKSEFISPFKIQVDNISTQVQVLFIINKSIFDFSFENIHKYKFLST